MWLPLHPFRPSSLHHFHPSSLPHHHRIWSHPYLLSSLHCHHFPLSSRPFRHLSWAPHQLWCKVRRNEKGDWIHEMKMQKRERKRKEKESHLHKLAYKSEMESSSYPPFFHFFFSFLSSEVPEESMLYSSFFSSTNISANTVLSILRRISSDNFNPLY